VGGSATSSGLPKCAPDVAPHGVDSDVTSWVLSMPANASAKATLPFSIMKRWAPWPSTHYGISVFVSTALEGLVADSASDTARTDGPPIVGRHGVQIVLKTKPAADILASDNTAVHAGQRVTVTGRTNPVIRRRTITLVVRDGPRQAKRFLRVETDAHGAFSTRVRFRSGSRIATVGARYTSHTKTLTSDYACPLAFDVEK
jgi:hypothetical protein